MASFLYILQIIVYLVQQKKNKHMKQLILLISFISISQIAFAQLPVVETVTDVACREFQNAKIPVKDMMQEEVEQIFIESRQDYLFAWDSTQRAFTQKVLLPFKYDEYFVRRLETKCPIFRPSMGYFDNYLKENPGEHKFYLKAREFIYAIEDEVSDEVLLAYIDKQAPITNAFWSIARNEIKAQKATSTLKFTQLDDYTYRCEYIDYITTERNFRIDILFTDDTDELINNVRITTKYALEQGYDSIDINFDIDEMPTVNGQ
jgi:hypothetical protein